MSSRLVGISAPAPAWRERAAAERPSAARAVAVFFYLWLMIGFFTGTVLLVGPMRWVTEMVRAARWPQRWENLLVWAIIVAYVAASLFVTRWVSTALWRARSRVARVSIPGAVTVLAAVCLAAWMDPGRMLASVGGGEGGRIRSASGAVFLFGAYPDRARLEELKRQGITAVVSLQHPAVVPFEPRSIAEEKRNAAELGLTFIHAPMLPWVSDNTESIEKLKQLARTGRGVYYVHCGLGRDRTNIAMRAISSVGAKVAASGSLARATTLAQRTAPMQRGRVFTLERDVWLVPFPNSAEFAGYFLAGQLRQVVSLLDPADSTQRAWLAEERRLLGAAGVALREVPLPRSDATRARAARIVQLVRTLPRPLAIIAPRTTFEAPYPGTEPAEAVRRAYARALAAADSAQPDGRAD